MIDELDMNCVLMERAIRRIEMAKKDLSCVGDGNTCMRERMDLSETRIELIDKLDKMAGV